MYRPPSDCLNAFVAEANIERLRKLLTTDEAKRKTLFNLLAEEEAKLAALAD